MRERVRETLAARDAAGRAGSAPSRTATRAATAADEHVAGAPVTRTLTATGTGPRRRDERTGAVDAGRAAAGASAGGVEAAAGGGGAQAASAQAVAAQVVAAQAVAAQVVGGVPVAPDVVAPDAVAPGTAARGSDAVVPARARPGTAGAPAEGSEAGSAPVRVPVDRKNPWPRRVASDYRGAPMLDPRFHHRPG